jgi:hypothetical protein
VRSGVLIAGQRPPAVREVAVEIDSTAVLSGVSSTPSGFSTGTTHRARPGIGAVVATSLRAIAIPAGSLPWMQPTTSIVRAACGLSITHARIARPVVEGPMMIEWRPARGPGRSRPVGSFGGVRCVRWCRSRLRSRPRRRRRRPRTPASSIAHAAAVRAAGAAAAAPRSRPQLRSRRLLRPRARRDRSTARPARPAVDRISSPQPRSACPPT